MFEIDRYLVIESAFIYISFFPHILKESLYNVKTLFDVYLDKKYI